ncbi:MAG TPA: 3-isopropylmalate dehydratase small subunit [Armatimonadetes bacterium]|jgi:3-isopropylmalate dehydratase small subunit|nr:3-isopropylmalate dehydratase small subunit [Armatimonadota bacterium]
MTRGKAHKYGDHVDTDAIIPARYLMTTDPDELAEHCMEDIDIDFVKKVQPGDIIVAGKNFGCGSSREHAPIAIKAAGVSCVIAANFARIFYRNAFNIGLPIIEQPQAAAEIKVGDELEVDIDNGIIRDLTGGGEWTFSALKGPVADLIEAGGLVNLTRSKLGADG